MSITVSLYDKLKNLSYEDAIKLVGQNGLTLDTITRYFDRPTSIIVDDYLPEFLKSEKALKQATTVLFKTLKSDKQVNIFSAPSLFVTTQCDYYDQYGELETEDVTSILSLYNGKLITNNRCALSWTDLLHSLKRTKFSVADVGKANLKKLLLNYMANSNN